MRDVANHLKGSTLLVQITRPDRANALRRRTIHQLEASLEAAEGSGSAETLPADTRVNAVVITGDSRRFSAGADLAELTGTPEDLRFDDALERLCRRIAHSPLPVVAAVEGACYGAAVDLAWACDAVVISEQARVALPSTRLGILYNPLSVARLHSRLGSSTVRRLMVLQQELAGRDLPPDAVMVTRPGEAVETALRLAQALSPGGRATAATKALLASVDSGSRFDPARWQAEREALLASPARREALRSHRDSLKRKQGP